MCVKAASAETEDLKKGIEHVSEVKACQLCALI